jgi:hypothetical protein
MVRINVKKPVYEDFRLGPQRLKSRRGISKDPKSHTWSFFGKAVMGALFAKKAFKKANNAPKSWDQRSIAKISYMKNSYQGQWGVHGRYLARQGAQLEDKPGLGFDTNDEDLNIPKTLKRWQEDGDPRLWKIIISPEMAHKLDLKEHIRAVMGHVEKDLGTKLEWVAIDHYNTDNPHAHVVLRGIDQNGKDLKINQEYFTKGFRQRSIQEATRALGLRLEQDVLLKRQENIRAMHITEIDREIARKLNKDNFISLKLPQSDFMKNQELQLKDRLKFLEEMGVAKSVSSVSWHVDPGFIDHLRFIQTQQDIVKTKNRHIKDMLDPNLPVVVNKLEHVGDTLIGMVVGMGLSESPGEPRYMLIEGIDNKIHYLLTPDGITKKRDSGDLSNGDLICLIRKEFIKEGENQEQKKIRYLFAESFKDLNGLVNNERLSEIDMYILNDLQKTRQIPQANPFDGVVRKSFVNLSKQRIEVLLRENVLFEDLTINEPKLNWSLGNNTRITKGLGLRLRPDWGPTPQGD